MSKRILVIDDEEAIRKSFLLALEESGYEVDTAESGEAGIEMQRKTKYDLIFLDLNMPGISGVETLREIRKQEPGLPVYIVTAFYREFLKDLTSVEKDGIGFELLKKPIGADEILLVTKGALEGPIQFES